MRMLNSEAGYGAVTKTLHWLTVVALIGQFVLGYGLDGLSERFVSDDSDADEALVFAHAWVGIAILSLAVTRLVWRRATPLPPWSERLTARDRRVAHRTEQLMYLLLFVIPATGLALLFLSGEERDIREGNEWQPPYDLVGADVLLPTHIAAHIAFYLALVVHIGLALRRGTLRRIV